MDSINSLWFQYILFFDDKMSDNAPFKRFIFWIYGHFRIFHRWPCLLRVSVVCLLWILRVYILRSTNNPIQCHCARITFCSFPSISGICCDPFCPYSIEEVVYIVSRLYVDAHSQGLSGRQHQDHSDRGVFPAHFQPRWDDQHSALRHAVPDDRKHGVQEYGAVPTANDPAH